MSVTRYDNPKCGYQLRNLRKEVFLFTSKGRIMVDQTDTADTGSQIVYYHNSMGAPLHYQVRSISIGDTSSIEGRYTFENTVTFSVNGLVPEIDHSIDYYVAVRSVDGTYWMVNPHHPMTVSYIFTLDSNGSRTDFTLSTRDMAPALELVGFDGATATECGGYLLDGLDRIFLNESKYSAANGGNIKYTNDGFREVVPMRNTAVYTENFSLGRIIQTLTFRIPMDEYKSSWHYTLLEFTENRYAAVMHGRKGGYYLAGFGIGMQPSYSVQADATIGNEDAVEVTLVGITNSRIGTTYTSEGSITPFTETEYIFTTEHDGYECVANNLAIYLLKREVDMLGNATGRYKVLEGYESYFPDIEITGTFDETEEFQTTLCKGFSGSCSTNLPEIVTFSTLGSKHFSVRCPDDCEWTAVSSDERVSVSIDRQNHRLTITNGITPTDEAVTATVTLTTCDMEKESEIRVVKNECLPYGTTYNTDCLSKILYIPLNCCVNGAVVTSDFVSTREAAQEKLGFLLSNNTSTESRTATATIYFCDGNTAQITIVQDKVYDYWTEDGRICSGTNLHVREVRYTGTTPSTITARTTEYRAGRLLQEDSTECKERQTKWVDTTEYVCVNNRKYVLQRMLESYDGGQTWTPTGDERAGSELPDPSGDCANSEKTQEWRVVDGYICDDANKHYRERLYISTDNGQTWTPTDTYRKGDIMEYNSTDCGYDPDIDGIYDKEWRVEGSTCDGWDKYERLRLYISGNGSLNWTPTDITKMGNLIEEKSADCGYDSEYEGKQQDWRNEGDTICDGTNKLQYLRLYVSDDGTSWTATNVYKRGDVIEYNSVDCGYDTDIDGTYYKDWRSAGTACDGFDKYEYQRLYVSSDSGVTWTETDRYRYGRLIERNSVDCGYDTGDTGVTIYEWRTTDGYLCDGTTKYFREKKWYSTDGGQNWIGTQEYRKGSVWENNSRDCGYSPTPYEYEEWRLCTETDIYYCNGTTKYYQERKWVSNDGATWTPTNVYRNTNMIRETNSTDCGYDPEEAEYRWILTSESACIDGGQGSGGKPSFGDNKAVIQTSGGTWYGVPLVRYYEDSIYEGDVPQGVRQAAVLIEFGPTILRADLASHSYDYDLLTTVIMPDSVTSVSNDGFRECPIDSLTLSPNITSIGWYAFYGNRLMTLTLPSKVSSVGEAAFANATKLKSIDMSSTSVTTLPDRLFQDDTALETISLPNGITSYGQYTFSGTALKRFDIPPTITTLPSSLFWGCRSLTSVTIPDTVTGIGDYCFAVCSALESLDIPASVQTIRPGALLNSGIRTLTMRRDTPPYVSGQYFNRQTLPYIESIKVPSGSVDAYKSDAAWSALSDIITAI